MKIATKTLLTFAATSLAVCGRIEAATATWVGAGADGNFGTAANWSTPAASGDALVFNAAGTSGTSLANNLSSATFAGITFNAGAPAYTIGGNGFDFTTGIANNAAVTQTFATGNYIKASGAVVLSTVAGGALTFTQDFGFVTAGDSVQVVGGGTVNFMHLGAGGSGPAGTITVDTGATATIAAGGYVNNFRGTINIAGTLTNNSNVGSFGGFAGTGNTTINVAGGIYNVAAGNGLSNASINLTNGTINLNYQNVGSEMNNVAAASGETGIVNVGSMIGSGGFTIKNGITFNIKAGSYVNSFGGTIFIANGAVLNNNTDIGSYQGFAGATTNIQGGTLNVNGGGARLTATTVMTGGTINTNTGFVANAQNYNTFNIVATAAGSGTLNIKNGITGSGTINIGSASGNTGAITAIMTGTSAYTNNFTGTINIAAGSIFTNGNAVTAYQGWGSGAKITVGGTYNANTASALQNLAGLTINTGGLVVLNAAGALAANGTFVNNGTMKVGVTGNLLTLSGTGGYTMNGILDLSGLYTTAGTYTLITGGTATDTAVSITGYNTGAFSASFAAGKLMLVAIPEPAVCGLAGAGMLALVTGTRRRKRA